MTDTPQSAPPEKKRKGPLFPRPDPHTFLRRIYQVGQEFVADKCLLRASALAFTTVLSLVPLLAVAFSISKGFGIQNSRFIREVLFRITAGKEETIEAIIGYINNTNVGTLGVLGIVILLVTAISLIGTIEKSFNAIWGVKRSRGFWRKFSDYLSVVLVCPLLVIIAVSSTASLQSSSLVQWISGNSVFSTLYIVLLKLLPYFTNILALVFVYTFIPNTKVKFSAALGGAVAAGAVWQITQAAYMHYQASFVNYNAIYGSFAQVPLFLIWMFISWVIVLLGAEISFALQYGRTLSQEARTGDYSFGDRQKLAALILSLLTRIFDSGAPNLSNEEIANRLKAPVKLVNDVLFMLSSSRITAKIENHAQDAYGLARSPDKVRLMDVMQALSNHRESPDTASTRQDFDFLDPVFKGMNLAAQNSPENLTLRELADLCEQGRNQHETQP